MSGAHPASEGVTSVEHTDVYKATEQAINMANTYRKEAADLAFEVGKAERERTLLRFTIADNLIQGGTSKTAAHDRARTDPEYVKASQGVDEITRRWENSYTDALTAQSHVELTLAKMADQRGHDRTKVVLRSVQAFITQHVRTLTLPDSELEAGE